MNSTFNEKRLTMINFIIVAYFIVLYFLKIFKVDFVLIGVFVELLTIPFLIAQVIFLVLGIKLFTKEEKPNYLTIISIASLAICTIITFGSFF